MKGLNYFLKKCSWAVKGSFSSWMKTYILSKLLVSNLKNDHKYCISLNSFVSYFPKFIKEILQALSEHNLYLFQILQRWPWKRFGTKRQKVLCRWNDAKIRRPGIRMANFSCFYGHWWGFQKPRRTSWIPSKSAQKTNQIHGQGR